MKKSNSENHKKVIAYNYIKTYFKRHGYMPSFVEIGNGIGSVSQSTVRKVIQELESDGMIKLGLSCSGKMSPRAIILRGMRVKFPDLQTLDWVKEEYKDVEI